MVFKLINRLYYNYIDKIKRYFAFTTEETFALIITTLAIAFMFSFNKWGEGNVFNPTIGIINFLLAIIIVASTIFVSQLGIRLTGIQMGFRIEYKMWAPGILIGLALVFVTNGKLWWAFAPGGFFMHHMAHHRIGHFRYGLNYWANASAAMMGIFSTLLFAIILKAIYLIFPSQFLHDFILFVIVFNFVSLVPIPPYDGSRIIFQGTFWWIEIFILSVIIAFILLFTKINLLAILIVLVLVLLIITYTYHLSFERQ